VSRFVPKTGQIFTRLLEKGDNVQGSQMKNLFFRPVQTLFFAGVYLTGNIVRILKWQIYKAVLTGFEPHK
jgi:hypothetical protein